MLEIPSFSIATINAHGLADNSKCHAFFHFLWNLSFDVILVQETHTAAGEHSFWTLMWGGPVCWTRHLGILGGHHTDLITFTPSHDGRLLEHCRNPHVYFDIAMTWIRHEPDMNPTQPRYWHDCLTMVLSISFRY